MARQFDNRRRQQINSQLCAADMLKSSAEIGSALALGGIGAEDIVSQVATLLRAGRTGYLRKLKLEDLAIHLPMVTSQDPSVMAIGIAALPLDQAPVLSKLTSIARHEFVVMVLDLHWEPRRKYSKLPGRSVYEHTFVAVMFEFNDDARVAGSYTTLTFTETTWGVPYFRPGAQRTDAGVKELKAFLKSKGIKPIDDSFHSNSCTKFEDILGYIVRWSFENPRYDIDSINCKAFARTMYQSFVAGEYCFCSDAGRDTWHKMAAHLWKGDFRSKDASRPSSGYRDVSEFGSIAAEHGLSASGYSPELGSMGGIGSHSSV